MSRSGYNEDYDGDTWSFIMWRGAVESAIRGKRGQLFFKELIEALEELPTQRLVKDELATATGEVCALGALGRKRGIDVEKLDPYDWSTVAAKFDIAEALSREVTYVNDEYTLHHDETPEARYQRVLAWAKKQIPAESQSPKGNPNPV